MKFSFYLPLLLMLQYIENFAFVDFVCLLGIIPLIVYLFNRNVTIETRYLLPLIFLTAFASLYEIVGTSIFQLRTKYWFRAYIFLEFYTVLYFYYKLLNFKKILLGFGIIYLVAYIYLLFQWNTDKRGLNDLPLNIIVTLTVICSSFFWFIEVFKKLEDVPLYRRIEFYYISVLLIYFCATFLMFLMTDYIINNDSLELLYYWDIIVIFNALLRLTLIFTVWKARVKLEH